jgi:hypothetical protein
MGSHPWFGTLLDGQRDDDIVFLGSTRDGRRQIVPHLPAEFARLAITVAVRDGSPQHGDVSGQERARLPDRTKILPHIVRQPWDDPAFRLVLDAGPFEPGRHFAMAPLDDLVGAVEHFHQLPTSRRVPHRPVLPVWPGLSEPAPGPARDPAVVPGR